MCIVVLLFELSSNEASVDFSERFLVCCGNNGITIEEGIDQEDDSFIIDKHANILIFKNTISKGWS